MSQDGFAIAWTAPARRALARLPGKVATAAVEFLYRSLAAGPPRAGRPLKPGLEGLHSAWRGDHRVICRIDGQHRRVNVMAIGHRSDSYRHGNSESRACRPGQLESRPIPPGLSRVII